MIKKFKTTAALQKAYAELEKAYTKKCQECASANEKLRMKNEERKVLNAAEIGTESEYFGEIFEVEGTNAGRRTKVACQDPLCDSQTEKAPKDGCWGASGVGASATKSAEPLGTIGSEDACTDSMGSGTKEHINTCDHLEQTSACAKNILRNAVDCDSTEPDSKETNSTETYGSIEPQLNAGSTETQLKRDSKETYGSTEPYSTETDSKETYGSTETYGSIEPYSTETQKDTAVSFEPQMNAGSTETQSETSSGTGPEGETQKEHECTRVPVYLLPNFKQMAADFFDGSPIASCFRDKTLELLVTSPELATHKDALRLAAAVVVGGQILDQHLVPELVKNLSKNDNIRKTVLDDYLAALRSRPLAPPAVKGSSGSVVATPKKTYRSIREAGESLLK